MKRMTLSLRVQALIISLLIIAPMFGFSILRSVQNRTLLARHAEEQLLELARLIAVLEERRINSIRQALRSITANLDMLCDPNSVLDSSTLRQITEVLDLSFDLAAADTAGVIVASTLPPDSSMGEGKNISHRPCFQQTIATGAFAMGNTLPLRAPSDATPSDAMPPDAIEQETRLILMEPVLGDDGRVLGILLAVTRPKWFEGLAMGMDLPDGARLTIRDRSGSIIARYPDPESVTGVSGGDGAEMLTGDTPLEGIVKGEGFDGITRTTAYRRIMWDTHSNFMYVTIGVPIDVIYADADRITRRNVFAVALFSAVVLIGAWVVTEYWILSPISSTIEIMRRVSAGNLSARLKQKHGIRELRELSDAFNSMAAALEGHTMTLTHLSFHDILTGAYNRTYFISQMASLERDTRLPMSLIVADANNLKLANDVYGHVAGDKLLAEIARILMKCCRKQDTLVRIGGDEFVLVLPSTPKEGAEAVCDRIREACNDAPANPVRPSLALGVATRCSMSMPIAEVLAEADARMYEDKSSRCPPASNKA